MVKSEKGMSLVKLIFIVLIALTLIMLITIILTGENGLINQWKSELNENKTNYVIKVNENQEM